MRPPALGRPFWRIWSASTISGLGSGMTYAALPLLAASYTRDPRLVSLVAVASFLPPLLFGLHSGAIVDRRDRRRIMWTTDLVRALVVGALAFAVATGAGRLAWLLVAALVLGAADILFENAASAIMPMLVTRDRLGTANSWLMSSQTISAQFVGLPAGGALFVVAAAAPFAFDALSFAAAVALVVTLGGRFTARAAQDAATTVWHDVREGTAWLARHRVLRTLALLLGAINCAFAIGESTLVLYCLQVLKVGQVGYALLLALLAVGGVAGTIIAEPLRRAIGPLGVVRVSLVGMAVAFTAPGLTSSLSLVVVALLLGGLASMLWNVVTITLRQQVVPDRLLGRVTSAYRVVGLGVMPVGALAGGFIAHRFGLHAPWLAAGALTLAAGSAGLAVLRSADIEDALSAHG